MPSPIPLLRKRDEEVDRALLTLSKPRDYERIIALTAVELKQGIKKGLFSRKDVVASFILRASSLRGLGALAEVRFREAMREAEKEDGEERSGLPFAGVPISCKDELQVKGFVSTCGLARKADLSLASANDGLLVHLLKANSGLVHHLRSNLPQLVISSETDNSVFGLCVSPWDAERIVGGSSGGEACLIASRCSPVGIGSAFFPSNRPQAACPQWASRAFPRSSAVARARTSCAEYPARWQGAWKTSPW